MAAKGSPVVLQQPASVKRDTSGDWDLIFPGENIKAGGKKKEWLLLEQNKPASTND